MECIASALSQRMNLEILWKRDFVDTFVGRNINKTEKEKFSKDIFNTEKEKAQELDSS